VMTAAPLVNPFHTTEPIRDPADFYGRKRELRRVFELVEKGACVNVIGERRSGKTSLLYQIAHPQVQARYLLQGERGPFIYLIGGLVPPEPQGFYFEVLRALKEKEPSLPFELQDGKAREMELRQALETLSPRRLTILIDEFEYIARNPQFPLRFFGFLRGLSLQYNLSFVIATGKRLVDSCPQEVATSPFANIFTAVEIGSFTEEEFQEFLACNGERTGLPLVEIQEQIRRLAGYFPYLVQRACWFYFEEWREQKSFDDQVHQRVRHAFEEDVRPYFDAVWHRYLDDEERQALLALVRGEQAPTRIIARLERRGHLWQGEILSEPFADYIRRVGLNVPVDRGVWLDEDSGNVYLDGKLVDPPLTAKEFAFLRLLCRERGKIYSPYEIVREVWGEDYIEEVDDYRISKLVSRLRCRIEPEGKPWKYVITVPGRGYKLGSGAS